MAFSFRLRFYRSPTDTIQIEANELVFDDLGSPGILRLKNPEANETILKASQLVLTGDGYASKEAAEAAGRSFESALMVALARHRIGADFGLRAPKGSFTGYGLSWLEQQIGQRVVNSVHGLAVFESDPSPRFALVDAAPLRGVSPEMFRSAFSLAVQVKPRLSEREEVAYSLFNASFFRQSADSRFLLLMMAIEALLELRPRSESARQHVASLIEQTNESTLLEVDRVSMIGALRWLSSESISQAGRRLAETRLGDRRYNDLTASKFFTNCYGLRSRLVHGSVPYPSFEEVGGIAGQLEVFVADLLTQPYLGLPA